MFSKKIIVNIDSMKCEHCTKKVEDIINTIDNVKSVKVNSSKKNVSIKYNNSIDIEKVKQKIEQLEYKFIGVEN